MHNRPRRIGTYLSFCATSDAPGDCPFSREGELSPSHSQRKTEPSQRVRCEPDQAGEQARKAEDSDSGSDSNSDSGRLWKRIQDFSTVNIWVVQTAPSHGLALTTRDFAERQLKVLLSAPWTSSTAVTAGPRAQRPATRIPRTQQNLHAWLTLWTPSSSTGQVYAIIWKIYDPHISVSFSFRCSVDNG